MVVRNVANTKSVEAQRQTPRAGRAAHDAWAFVYIFFTNGIPFDSPNRSEPCPRC